ncbi:DBH-like monooxygenase protein 2 [Orchesella cincta]|uniref:DBH-like monooxygenase protein 2 n=1 Tax=Orchesella cincta TaxID=48709 RepID=A0A1D2NJU2_ORCCI|nr:DBH-like monooxygenase protein 2 [Orchesella cincta]
MAFQTSSCNSYYLDNHPYRHKQVLGPKATYVVEWSVNWKENQITFQVSAETKGWIGFGLSRDGRMTGSDVVIGGVSSNGKPYFNDAHIKGNRTVQSDQQQDWKLLGAWERGKRTYLSFTRPLDTCDLQDYPITSDLIVLIWAYGDTDEVQYHAKRRGSFPLYLLDPEIASESAHSHYRQIGPHSNTLLVQRCAISSSIRLPARPTSVWCSIHQGPTLGSRHDLVGMGALLPTPLARRYVQQMLLYKCTTPQQTDANTFFQPYANITGEECYMNENRVLPLSFCRELLYVWGRGSRPFYFPEDIGIPIGESPNEYYLLETYYDNPKNRPNVEFEAGIEIVFSHRTKANQASLLQIGYGQFGTFMIPPRSVMNIYGSCGSKCTALMFPKDGANVFAAMLHSRSLGRRVRLQHFRNGQELPWIIKDDNYDSEFQQMRLLKTQVSVLPGDQLTTQCTFDSHDRNRTSFSGFSTEDETCMAFAYISRRIPFFRCTSEYPAERLMAKYGINNFTWDTNWQERYVTVPKQEEGTWIGDIIDKGFQSSSAPMTPEQLQQELQFAPHLGSCPNINDIMANSQNKLFKTFTNNWQQQKEQHVPTRTPYLSTTVAYPQSVKEYQETPYCRQFEHNPNPTVESPLPIRPAPLSRPSFVNPVPIRSLRRPNVEHTNPLSIFQLPKPNVESPRPVPRFPLAKPIEEAPRTILSFSRPTSTPAPGPTPIVDYAFPPGAQINNFFQSERFNGPTFRIPMVRNDAVASQSKLNFFDQLANLFLTPSNNNDVKRSSREVQTTKVGVSFQNYISDLLKKRSS